MQDANMVKEILENFKEEAKKSILHLKNEYSSIRAGRANPHILDKVLVDYYGNMTPLNQMANINIAEARLLTINVWDMGAINAVRKAIQMADLGVNISDDGRMFRLSFPILSEERRREIVKVIKKICEDIKVSIRNARRDCLDMFKEMKKEGELSEDEYAGIDKDVQKILETMNDEAEKICASKEKEIMEV